MVTRDREIFIESRELVVQLRGWLFQQLRQGYGVVADQETAIPDAQNGGLFQESDLLLRITNTISQRVEVVD